MFRAEIEASFLQESDCEEPATEDDGHHSSKDTFAPIANAVPSMLRSVLLASSVAHDTESPIETLFAVAFMNLVNASGLQFIRCTHLNEKTFGPAENLLIHQYGWNSYRIDFAIKLPALRQPLFFVECDGREFHSSDAQILRDRQKDQLASEAGIPMARFTGSDLDRNAAACAQVVFGAIQNRYLAERGLNLTEATTRKACGGCRFKVELGVTPIRFASTLAVIQHFHRERDLEIRQGSPESRYGDNRQFVRWYFENLEHAAEFQAVFGGRLICSSAP